MKRDPYPRCPHRWSSPPRASASTGVGRRSAQDPRTRAAGVARCCELETPIAASAGVGSSLRSTQPTRLSVHRPSSNHTRPVPPIRPSASCQFPEHGIHQSAAGALLPLGEKVPEGRMRGPSPPRKKVPPHQFGQMTYGRASKEAKRGSGQ